MSTRLSEVAKSQSREHLRGLLNNIPRFVECPITDREAFLNLWNSKFPADLYQSVKILGSYGCSPVDMDACRFTVDIGTKTVSALIKPNACGLFSAARASAGTPQSAIGFLPILRKDKDFIREVMFDDGGNRSVVATLQMTPEYIVAMLGVDKGKELLEWMVMCADMRDELILASKTLTDIFSMAVTAGQIKRMVPDLLQYLPGKQRAALEEQKRASTVPFEWAPYPKKNIDAMLLQISKGHLLSNMNKPRNEEISVTHLDYYTWARYGKWVS